MIESLQLAGQCRVHLVRAGGRYLLAGLDGSGLKVVLAAEGPLDEQEGSASEPEQLGGKAA